MVRDIGFIQAAVNGNLLGDPINAGAWRWYPPLIHWVTGTVVRITGVRLLPFWSHLGPWINALAPLTFLDRPSVV